MGWPFAYMIGVPASTSSGSLSRSIHTRAIPGASAGICACALDTSPGGAQAAGASRQTPSKASLMRWFFMIRMILPRNAGLDGFASALHAKNDVNDAPHLLEPLRVQVAGHLDVLMALPGDLEGEARGREP